MTTHYFVLQTDGLKWIEKMPEKPIHTNMGSSDYRDNAFNKIQDLVYQQALQSAISNAKEVTGEIERLIERIKWNIYCENAGFRQPKGFHEIVDKINLEVGIPYPMQCSVKKEWVGDTEADSPVWKLVALVTFPSSAGVEETQEELWKQMFQQIGSRMDFMQFLLEHYTITRKNL